MMCEKETVLRGWGEKGWSVEVVEGNANAGGKL